MVKAMVGLILFIILSAYSSAYPIVITEYGLNHSANKELVYSLPEINYKYVDSIEFKNLPLNCKATDKYGQLQCRYEGFTYVYWDKNHNCYKGRIILYDNSLIMHELLRVYQHCVLKWNISIG